MGEDPGTDRPDAGGVVFRAAGELFFLPASIAMKVIPLPALARVPGGPTELRGVALVDGAMIPVVDIAEDRSSALHPRERAGEAMLVCALLGEPLGLVGLEVVATGRFPAGEEAGEVEVLGETARTFDVASAIAKVREGRWAV